MTEFSGAVCGDEHWICLVQHYLAAIIMLKREMKLEK